ncbi:MAG: hypothetical protein IJF15_00550 [Oscillospiraceae bacterium]|nr:hypothetical protein [Oscillospiraceae bacterium]
MNYAEEMLARQQALWRCICALFPAQTEDEVRQKSKDGLFFGEELRAAQELRDTAFVQERGLLHDASVQREAARRAAYAVMGEMQRGAAERDYSTAERARDLMRSGIAEQLHGGIRRAGDAREMDALMRALSEESAQRSARMMPDGAQGMAGGARAVGFDEAGAGEAAAYFASAYGQAKELYGVPLAMAQEMHTQGVFAQEVSRRFERDSRRYDAAFTRYE